MAMAKRPSPYERVKYWNKMLADARQVLRNHGIADASMNGDPLSNAWTDDTFGISAHIAARIANAMKYSEPTEADLRYILERELDRFVEQGVLKIVKPKAQG